MGGTPSSARIIEDVDRALEALKIVVRANGAAVQGIADIDGHIRKEVGRCKSFSWGDTQTKGEDCECKLTKNMFFHRDLLRVSEEKTEDP